MRWLSRKTIRRACAPRNLLTAATLAAYAAATIGLPLGRLQAPKPTDDGCACSAELKAAGRCCCHKHAAGKSQSLKSAGTTNSVAAKAKTPQRSCCRPRREPKAARPPVRPAEGCCRTKERPAAQSDNSTVPQASACSCDGDPEPAVIVNADPRLPARKPAVPSTDFRARWSFESYGGQPQCSVVPETPPPEVRVC